VDSALSAFLEHFGARVARGGRSEATLGMHRAHAEIIRRSIPPGLRLVSLSVDHVEQLVDPAISGGTIRKRLSTLWGALELAHRRGHLQALPARPEVDYVYRPTEAHLKSVDELRQLCAELPPSRAEWVTVAVYTGMHASDVDAWRAWIDADPFAGWMMLFNRKNRRAAGVRVKMPAELGEVLRRRFEGDRLRPGQPVVRAWPAGTRGHQLADAAQRAGLGHINATALRHTCGTWLVRRLGITPAAAKWMGHSSTTMLERVYAHALPVQLEQLTAELDSMGDAGAARRPPQQASDGPASSSTTGNRTRSMVEGDRPEGAATPPGPGSQRAGGKQRARYAERTVQQLASTSQSVGRVSVPRDRVELSTHGFSVGAPLVASSVSRDAFDGPSGRRTPCAPHLPETT